MMKKRLAALLMAATMGVVSIPVHASEQPTVSVEQAEGITVKTTTYDDHQVVKVTDEDGNVAIADSKEDYIIQNGEKIDVSVVTEEITEPEDGIVLYALSDWKKIRSYRSKIAVDKALGSLTRTALITLLISKADLPSVLAHECVDVIYAYHKKPNYKSKKAFYMMHVIYGYIYVQNKEATKNYAQDANKNTIKGSTTYSDPAIKGK